MKKVETKIISGALRIVARDILTGDGVANSACIEAADRLDEQELRIKELLEEINENMKDNLRFSRFG